jgi:hypothetical protein
LIKFGPSSQTLSYIYIYGLRGRKGKQRDRAKYSIHANFRMHVPSSRINNKTANFLEKQREKSIYSVFYDFRKFNDATSWFRLSAA